MYKPVFKLCARCGVNQGTTKFCFPCRPLAYGFRGPKKSTGKCAVCAGETATKYCDVCRKAAYCKARDARKAIRYRTDAAYRERRLARMRVRPEDRKRRRRVDGLLWECTASWHVGERMIPRGNFGRNGRKKDGTERTRHSHCRMCRREHKSNNAARRRGAGVTKIPKGWIRRLMLEQRGRCGICGLTLDPMFHVDHKRPISRGGRHEYGNLQLAHKRCNLTCSNKLK